MVRMCEKCGRPDLLGHDLTKLGIEGVYLNKDATKVYIEVSRSWNTKYVKDRIYHLGYISFPLKHVLEWLLTANESENWEENVKGIKRHKAMLRGEGGDDKNG